MSFKRNTKEAAATQAGAPQHLVERHEEDRVVDGQGKGNVSHVTGTVDVVQAAGSAQVMLVRRAQGWVVESTQVGVQQAVKDVWVGDLPTANLFDLCSGVGEESNGRESAGGCKPGVYSPDVYHCRLPTARNILHEKEEKKMVNSPPGSFARLNGFLENARWLRVTRILQLSYARA